MTLRTRLRHPEGHAAQRAGWLRAAVLGSNDGLVSTSSLVVGVAASGASGGAILTAGIAGLTAGALSMAVGEYVSVSAQADVERADRALEQAELEATPAAEFAELTGIYERRGLPRDLAEQVATALTEHDALAAHLRDELGHNEINRARPLQACAASAGSFTAGALVPFAGLAAPAGWPRIVGVVAVTVVGLAVAGALSARTAGTPLGRPTLRVVLGGCAAMAATALVGLLSGTATG
ncbi:VIT1/CCC1 transporter family protein [Frankia sp. AgKG'84/4]|uniref:VIT1/CCC1 transporter family protein n=1 Tax=Frankia sp. AgKG'84/4 TaxID=573490 RepID=UPI00200ECB69|nr:VIT family protein [Frankia sp. AgKG'84/4]MCL9796007.1 VIT family protein [Frankia sp. AgKG'84/4]